MKILLVEDNANFAHSLVYLMEGLDITVVGSLAAARSSLDAGRFNLVLLDLGLPDSSGLDTLRALRGYNVPKVVLTAALDANGEWAKLGAMDFITKSAIGYETMYERIMFNVSKLEKKPRFTDAVFHEIRACFEARSAGLELTHAV